MQEYACTCAWLPCLLLCLVWGLQAPCQVSISAIITPSLCPSLPSSLPPTVTVSQSKCRACEGKMIIANLSLLMTAPGEKKKAGNLMFLDPFLHHAVFKNTHSVLNLRLTFISSPVFALPITLLAKTFAFFPNLFLFVRQPSPSPPHLPNGYSIFCIWIIEATLIGKDWRKKYSVYLFFFFSNEH